MFNHIYQERFALTLQKELASIGLTQHIQMKPETTPSYIISQVYATIL